MKKNETIQIQKNDSYLGDVPLGGFVVKSENRKLFENFCRRNRIPFLKLYEKYGKIIYTMREGLDMSDAYMYMLRMTHSPNDEEQHWDLACLGRKLCKRTYEYEQNLYRTPKDQWRLDHYDEWDPQKEKTAK